MGQFFTPAPVARMMASMFSVRADTIRLLDAGAGVGSLFAACVEHFCTTRSKPKRIEVCAYELDESLLSYLEDTADLCGALCEQADIVFAFDLRIENFLESISDQVANMFSDTGRTFNAAILNPPYFKIGARSAERRMIRKIGVETSNIYTGFVAGAIRVLEKNGELVAITPRSFCNGPYFRPFRRFLLERMSFRRIHVFHSRSATFRGDDVLQENIIFHAKKTPRGQFVELSASVGPDDRDTYRRRERYDHVVQPDDTDYVIHVGADGEAEGIRESYARFGCSLDDLGLAVSTGRVVDFRVRDYLHANRQSGDVPLIYPVHLRDGFVRWPNGNGRKPNAIAVCDATQRLLVPSEFYVIVKRFSAKEERRRIVAAVYDPARLDCDEVGFENHLNFFHSSGRGIDKKLAKGLAVFLNSTLVDRYFRQFSGHTQVNATDLRNMSYPSRDKLITLGNKVADVFPDQKEVDRLLSTI